jgi:ABC-type Mn2+/Zn2+ transport system permease subunit
LMPPHVVTLAATIAMGVACALLSVIVVTRRWAFIGEGIAHGGFGGAGTAWLLSLVFPSAAFLAGDLGVYAIAVFFCLGGGGGIGGLSRRAVAADTAIGIFLVASLAWGFIAQRIYLSFRGGSPPGWEDYLLGPLGDVSATYALAAVAMCIIVAAIVFMLNKEILYYCFDPAMAEVSGVRVGVIHYLLILLVAAAIIVGMKLMGSLLVTALLVLPGAAALQLGRQTRTVMAASVAAGVLAAIVGPLFHFQWPAIPEGPAIVLVLVLEFVAAYAFRRAADAWQARSAVAASTAI